MPSTSARSSLRSRATIGSFFLFNGTWAPPDAHSFPTRRSSDLAGLPVGDVVVDLNGAVRHARDGACRTDRKSTRLNSSHITISYAVFCLKKKNENAPTFALAGDKDVKFASWSPRGCRHTLKATP